MLGHNTKTIFCSAFLVGFIFFGSALVHAEGNAVDILPSVHEGQDVMDGDETHEALKLTPDKSELIHFDKAIGSIVIGNPTHVNVMADSSSTIVVIPRKPGATHFIVLDTEGQILMQRHVIVAALNEDYVRVKRVCADPKTCEETSVFYCPDSCHEIGLDEGQPLAKGGAR